MHKVVNGARHHDLSQSSDMVLRPAKAVHALRPRLGGTFIVRPFGHLEDIYSQYHYTLPEVFITYHTFADQPYQPRSFRCCTTKTKLMP